MIDLAKDLKALGDSSHNAQYYNRSEPDARLLECFTSPFAADNRFSVQGAVTITAPEFTALCPKTGQPDFATIEITYTPRDLCVESKSLKLYLGSFRNHGEFHESCVNRICNDLVLLLKPRFLKVVGKFAPRGGISFHPTAVWEETP